MKSKVAQPCPCGGASYADCCGPLHAGVPAGDPQRLMRSRYSAFVMKLSGYLLNTWHPDTRPAELDLADDKTQWLRLELLRHETSADTGIVEFVARYKLNGRAHRLHEISRFVRGHKHESASEDARWYYLDGELLEG
jgi:SEC-C motif-containing protein